MINELFELRPLFGFLTFPVDVQSADVQGSRLLLVNLPTSTISCYPTPLFPATRSSYCTYLVSEIVFYHPLSRIVISTSFTFLLKFLNLIPCLRDPETVPQIRSLLPNPPVLSSIRVFSQCTHSTKLWKPRNKLEINMRITFEFSYSLSGQRRMSGNTKVAESAYTHAAVMSESLHYLCYRSGIICWYTAPQFPKAHKWHPYASEGKSATLIVICILRHHAINLIMSENPSRTAV